jgi:hypothetical protein
MIEPVSRSYNSDEIRKVIDWITQYADLEVAGEAEKAFKRSTLEYLHKDREYDELSIQWAIEEIGKCNDEDLVCILIVLGTLNLVLMVDLVIETGRNCLQVGGGYEEYLRLVAKFITKQAKKNKKAFDAIMDRLPTKGDGFSRVREIRSLFEELKSRLRGEL